MGTFENFLCSKYKLLLSSVISLIKKKTRLNFASFSISERFLNNICKYIWNHYQRNEIWGKLRERSLYVWFSVLNIDYNKKVFA